MRVELGLPHNLTIRIAVHAGPVYVSFDPVIRQMTFTGAHVSRAGATGHPRFAHKFAGFAHVDRGTPQEDRTVAAKRVAAVMQPVRPYCRAVLRGAAAAVSSASRSSWSTSSTRL